MQEMSEWAATAGWKRRLSVAVLFLLMAGLNLACSEGESSSVSDEGGVEAAAAGPTPVAQDSRPSILFVVLDTVRADAISAYGAVEGTTPIVDALAAEGTRFAHAYSASSWTVSSHASMFSGLRVDQHGVGLDGVYVSPESLTMLAERLQEEGYETAAFAENSLVSPDFGFGQGFDHFAVTDMADVVKAEASGEQSMAFFGLPSRVAEWSRKRDATKPAFVFVNIMDAHDPYTVRDVNRWAPSDADARELSAAVARYPVPTALCGKAPKGRDREIMRGLYLGDVSAADEKLGRVLQALGAGGLGRNRITIVTSDHGEHLGEHALSGHRYSVRTPSIHVPLVVTGAPDLAPGVSKLPVSTRRLKDAVLCWADAAECPSPLVVERGVTQSEPIISIWSDRAADVPGPIRETLGISPEYEHRDPARDACAPDVPVFGELVSMIQYPHKMNWAGTRIIGLHDLSWDPGERSDQRRLSPELAARFGEKLERFVTDRVMNRAPREPTTLDADTARALKALGYME